MGAESWQDKQRDVAKRGLEKVWVKDKQGGLDMGAIEGPRYADDAPALLYNLYYYMLSYNS